MHSVFDYGFDSSYDDDIPYRYHFPDHFLKQAEQSEGDWIVYRHTTRGGGKGEYIAVAKVVAIEPHPSKQGHYYARMSDFRSFAQPVPLRPYDGSPYEDLLKNVHPSNFGRTIHGKSVRYISEADFRAICHASLQFITNPANATGYEVDLLPTDQELLEFVAAPSQEQERLAVHILANRKLRDVAFRKTVLDAYDNRCAVTGWRIINGGGKAETQAAHILPVKENGPDFVRNGIALSATAHWLFNQHLISLTDDCDLLIAPDKVPSELRNIFPREKQRIHLPRKQNFWPHPKYLQQHREKYIAHNPQ